MVKKFEFWKELHPQQYNFLLNFNIFNNFLQLSIDISPDSQYFAFGNELEIGILNIDTRDVLHNITENLEGFAGIKFLSNSVIA